MVEHEDIQMEQLAQRALTKFFFLAAGMSLLLFLPAGTVHFWQAWGFLCVFLGASFLLTVYLLMKNPELLKRRLRAGPTAEKEKTQKVIMSFAALGFVATMIVPAIDHRFLWSNVPPAVTIVSDALIALAFFLIFLVYRENSFGSATVQISEGQRVISTGPYALVRHPMYVGGATLVSLHAAGARLVLGFVGLCGSVSRNSFAAAARREVSCQELAWLQRVLR